MRYHDYEEFIAALNAREVRYLIAGSHAVAYHATPRATKDLDIFLDPEPGNAGRALVAMKDFFGGADLGYRVEDPRRTERERAGRFSVPSAAGAEAIRSAPSRFRVGRA